MAHWTVSGSPRNDAARAKETRAHVAKELAGWGEVKKEHQDKFRKLYAAHIADLSCRAKRRRVRQAIKEWKDICEQERQMKAFVSA